MANSKLPQARPGFKTCKRCLLEKPLEDFQYEPRVKSKTTARCRMCLKLGGQEYALAHPEKVKASREKYRTRYPERVRAAQNFTNRRVALERREKRIAAHIPLMEPRETDDGRLCSRCRKRKPTEMFPPNAASKDGISCYCRECTNRIGRQNTKKPAVKKYRRRYMRALALKKYGMTLEEFEAKVKEQDGKCAICKEELKFGTGGCAVDHDHTTNRVRGLLCRLCNVGVGHFRENPELLLRAVAYLRNKSTEDVGD